MERKKRLAEWLWGEAASFFLDFFVPFFIKEKRKADNWMMEVDRFEQWKGYVKGNLRLACYWCSNAKTDEFSGDEFKLIADGIKEVWRKRIMGLDSKRIQE